MRDRGRTAAAARRSSRPRASRSACDHGEALLDRVRGVAALGGVAGTPAMRTWNHSTPTCAVGDRGAERLGDHGGVGRVAGEQRLAARRCRSTPPPRPTERAPGRAGASPSAAEAAHRPEDRGQPALHVGGAAAVEPAVLAIGPNGSRSRHMRARLRAHDVDVAVQDQRPARRPAGRQSRPRCACRRRPSRTARARGWARRASASIGTSTGSSPSSRRTSRHTAWPASSLPSSVGASTRPDQQLLDRARSAATASGSQASSGSTGCAATGRASSLCERVRLRLTARGRSRSIEEPCASRDHPLARSCSLLTGCGHVNGAGQARPPQSTRGRSAPARARRRRGKIEVATPAGFRPRFWPGVNLGSTVPGRRARRGGVIPRRLRPLARRDGPARRPRGARLHDPAARSSTTPCAPTTGRTATAPIGLIQGVWIPEERVHRDAGRLRARGDQRLQAGDRRRGRGRPRRRRPARCAAGTPAAATAATSSPLAAGLVARRRVGSVGREPHRPTGAHRACRRTTARYITAAPSARRRWRAGSRRCSTTPPTLEASARLEPAADVHQLAHHRPAAPPARAATPRRTRSRSTPMHMRATAALAGRLLRQLPRLSVLPRLPAPARPDATGARTAADPYAGYLRDLRRHHRGQAVMITEFGVPTGIGVAHRGPLGRDQGDHTEQEAGRWTPTCCATSSGEGYRRRHALRVAGRVVQVHLEHAGTRASRRSAARCGATP